MSLAACNAVRRCARARFLPRASSPGLPRPASCAVLSSITFIASGRSPIGRFLHYNSWYDISWKPFALNEGKCLEAIKLCGDNLVKRQGAVLDAMVFDDGWDDPHTLWQFHAAFPHGFAPLAEACRRYGMHLGTWLSPFGGYGKPKQQRLAFGREHGFETNAGGFSLAGPKYYAAFKQTCVKMIRDYGVNFFKFDGIGANRGPASGPGPQYLADTEALCRLMFELRGKTPTCISTLRSARGPRRSGSASPTRCGGRGAT